MGEIFRMLQAQRFECVPPYDLAIMECTDRLKVIKCRTEWRFIMIPFMRIFRMGNIQGTEPALHS
ncbi:hypothetical protein SCOR_16695 [Sulfidibacter corallicola]